MSNNGKYHYIMVKAPKREGAAFKRWCRAQGISMNCAFNIMIKKVIRGNFVCEQAIQNKK